ncbi:MAG: hypothetical protein U1F46_03120 [Marinagarivorans sp.]
MEIVQWIVFFLFGSASIFVLITNYVFVYTSYSNKKKEIDRHVSMVPFAAPILALLATFASPISVVKVGVGFAGVVLILDIGSTGILVMFIILGLKYV